MLPLKMSIGAYATNQSDWNFRKWLLPMLIASILLHLGLLLGFQQKKLDNFVPVQTERLVPRPFNVKRAEIDPRILQDTTIPKSADIIPKVIPKVEALDTPSTKLKFENALGEIRAAPPSADFAKPLLDEPPKIDPAAVSSVLNQMEQQSSRALERELEELRKELTAEKPASLNQPALTAEGLVDSSSDPVLTPSNIASLLKGENAGPDVGTPGFSNLDTLLSQTGPLTSSMAPILMPTDLLFDYDSFSLREGAVTSMSSLGRLIQKNPNATFVIEGHSDSFGSPQYNLELSKQRAESVKLWLIENMGVNPARVATRGFGSSKLLVSPAKSVEEQQLNRRVEIVIRTK